MHYDFDEPIKRENTNSFKFDYTSEYFGTSDLIPMWVADMDFRTPDFIMEAIRNRMEHEILGYSIRPESFYQAIIKWYKKRQDWSIERDWILFSPGVVAALSLAVNAFTSEGEKIILVPSNPDHKPVVLDEHSDGVKIIGKIRAVIRITGR